MGYRDSDDSGFSRHGMNRDSDHYDPQQHGTQRSHPSGYDHPDLDRDEDLRTSHSVPLDSSRQGRNEPYAGRRDGQQGYQGYQGARGWEGRDRYQGQGGSGYSAGYGYGARSPDIGGYDPYESEQRYRQQQYGGGYGGGGHHGPGERSRLNRPEGWAREGYGAYDRDPYQGDTGYGQRQGRSYGYGYDGRPDGGGYGYAQDDRQDRFAGSSYGDRQQGSQARYGSNHNGNQRHDPDYAAWRQEQLRALDEDYDSWRNERYQKFSDEFNTWRSSRSRNQGNDLRGSNQSDQVTASGSSKNPQGTTATHAGSSSASSGNKAKD